MEFLRHILPLALAAIALTLATHTVAVPPPPEGPARAYPTVIPCPTVLPPNEIEGKTITCGISPSPKTTQSPSPRVDWGSRDAELAEAVRLFCYQAIQTARTTELGNNCSDRTRIRSTGFDSKTSR